ncbi:MAG TPA: hypothetical protein VN132_06325, partial [Bdellovibrio sp.]|nr:hypothetical protein [Bdellovibrio sp.]
MDKAGYLKRLEKNFSSVSKNERHGVGAERKRVQDALKSIEQKIAAMWRGQMEGALNAEALKMVSEEMNQLAGEKRDLVAYSENLEERAGVVQDIEARMDFLGDRLDDLVRGWKKASAVKQKLLLKRALLGVVASATETKIIYLNSTQQESDLVAGGTQESSIGTEVLGKVVNGIGPDTKKPSRDEKVLSAFRIKVGRPEARLVEQPDAIKAYLAQWSKAKLDLTRLAKLRWIENLKTPDLCKAFGLSRTTVRQSIRTLRKCGISELNLTPEEQKTV